MSRKKRCDWVPVDDIVYHDYHDEEWGMASQSDAELFEKISLEGFQAGLSWRTVLNKRDGFRRCFADFDPAVVAGFSDQDVERLVQDSSIIRNRAKIVSTINNARRTIELQSSQSSLRGLLWGLALTETPDASIVDGVLTQRTESAASALISKSLKKLGFSFVGPTTMYALAQSEGMVNDHDLDCPARKGCSAAREECLDQLGLS